jgi:hypothetical protein
MIESILPEKNAGSFDDPSFDALLLSLWRDLRRFVLVEQVKHADLDIHCNHLT